MEIDNRIKLLKEMGVFYYQSHQYVKNYFCLKESFSVEHPIMLFLISRYQPILQKDIASMLKVKPATVSVHLKHLERAGLIIREAGKEDRRQSFVSLTPKGIQLLDEGIAMLLKLSSEVTEPLVDEEVEQLMHLVQKMLDHLGRKEEKGHA